MSSRLSITELKAICANRNYASYMVGNFLTQTGEWAQRLAIGWLAWELTKSPFWLGIILFADLAPTIIISPLGGALVDRVDRLRLVRMTVWMSFAQPAALFAAYLFGILDIWFLLVATFYIGVIHSVNQTARLAIMPLLVPQKDIPRSTPLNSISFNMARFLGPMLFGLIALVAPVEYAFVVNAVFYLSFGMILGQVTLREESFARKERKNLLYEAVEGIHYALTHPGIGPLLIVLLASSFGTRPFMDLLPGFAGQVFGRGAEALAVMTSITAAGAFCGAIYLVLRSSIVGLARVSMAASMLTGVGLMIFATVDDFFTGLVILFFIGIGLSVSAVGVLSLAQAAVPGEMRGRVVSTYGIIFRGGPAIGGLAMGWIAEWTGLGWPVGGGGLLCVLVWFWILRRLKKTSRILEADISKASGS